MPGFANMLTQDEIAEIVRFERSCLDEMDYTKPLPDCATPPQSQSPATTTTTTKPGG
jgi:hypothetical protein